MEDLTGKQFDKLLVVGQAGHTANHKIKWECHCSCGATCEKTRDYLLNVNKSQSLRACTKACGAALPAGTEIGNFIILETISKAGSETQYKCQCKCYGEDSIKIVTGTKLKNGNTFSCGCYRKQRMSEIGGLYSEKIDITNQQFGKLTAIEPTEERQSRSVVWRCQCECGNFHNASVPNLKSGSVTRCPECKVASKGEEEIIALLTANNILFEKEKTFDTCVFDKTNKKCRFDFYINNSYLIEFDGRQHFEETSGWHTGLNFQSLQEHDVYKNQWCKENNIPLIKIPYTQLGKISLDDLLLNKSKFLLTL